MATRRAPSGRSLLVFAAVNAAVAAVIAVVAIADPGGSPPAGDGVTATVEQTTAFQARGLLEVAFSNRGDRILTMSELRLVDGRFAPVAPTARDVEIPPSPRRVMIPIEYGDPVCPPSAAGREPIIEVRRGGHRPVQVSVDAEGDEFLDRLYDRECGQQRVRETVAVSFTGPFEDAGPATVRLSLRLERLAHGGEGEADAEPVVLAAVRGTVVFTVAVVAGAREAPVLEMGPHDDAAETVLEVSASRCDAHALIESKKSYRFPMWIGVGGAEPRYLEVEPKGEAREVLEAALQEGCFG